MGGMAPSKGSRPFACFYVSHRPCFTRRRGPLPLCLSSEKNRLVNTRLAAFCISCSTIRLLGIRSTSSTNSSRGIFVPGPRDPSGHESCWRRPFSSSSAPSVRNSEANLFYTRPRFRMLALLVGCRPRPRSRLALYVMPLQIAVLPVSPLSRPFWGPSRRAFRCDRVRVADLATHSNLFLTGLFRCSDPGNAVDSSASLTPLRAETVILTVPPDLPGSP